jgi:hypothetical protein
LETPYRTWRSHHAEQPARERLCVSEAAQRAADRRHPCARALARFDQVEGVTDSDRELAFANIKKAAAHYGVDIKEKSWRELGKKK